tara:strand:- start:1010 stop:1453 length:444 start_codon:yes stop_codon:yes gene_type:complete
MADEFLPEDEFEKEEFEFEFEYSDEEETLDDIVDSIIDNTKLELVKKFEKLADEITDLFCVDFKKSTEQMIEATFQEVGDQHGADVVYESGFAAGAMGALIWLHNRNIAQKSGEFKDLYNKEVFKQQTEFDDLCDKLFNPESDEEGK